MHSVMFDIDGTLVDSFGFDEACYNRALYEVMGQEIDACWQDYTHITDSGLLIEFIERSALSESAEQIQAKVKPRFLKYVEEHLNAHGLSAIEGAVEFLEYLTARDDISLSIATGGWLESAMLKLDAAGFDTKGIPKASSNDHHARIDIMKLALQRAEGSALSRPIYFGDAKWDKEACTKLGFRFILVGSRVSHTRQIDNFNNIEGVLQLMGINY